jgi:DNA invertase Pin-like site-specific DNA recombinase
MRCACYARYSTDLQREESIEDQLRNLRNFAESRSWQVLPSHIYADLGISGASTDRPALKAMITAALGKPVPFDVILVDDTSRLSRNLAEAMQLKQQLEFAGIRLIAVSQGVDSADDQADVIWTVHGLVDSLFLKELSRKRTEGWKGWRFGECTQVVAFTVTGAHQSKEEEPALRFTRQKLLSYVGFSK